VLVKNLEHAFGPCTSRKTVYDAAPTSVHDKVPLRGTFVRPFAGPTIVGIAAGQPVEVEADPELLAEFVSAVVDVAVAVLTIVVTGPAITV